MLKPAQVVLSPARAPPCGRGRRRSCPGRRPALDSGPGDAQHSSSNNNRPFQVLAPAPSHCSTVPDLHGWSVPSEQGGKFSLLISCWNKKQCSPEVTGQSAAGSEVRRQGGGSQRSNISVQSDNNVKQQSAQMQEPGVFGLVEICHMTARCLLTVTNIINKLVPPRDGKINVHAMFLPNSKVRQMSPTVIRATAEL